MADVKIQPLDNGPYLVTGDVELVDADGTRFQTKSQIYLCRCGLSKNKPFCDGSHKNHFESVVKAR